MEEAHPLRKLLGHMSEEWPWEEKALTELNDIPELREQKLSQLKQKIEDYCEKHTKFKPLMEDWFLIAFLRTRKFDVQKTMDCFVRYYKIRLCNPGKIFPVGKGPRDYASVYEKPIASIIRQRNPLDGTSVIVWSFRNFDAEKDELEGTFNATFYAAFEMIQDPSMQTFGARFIFDMTGINYSIMKKIITNLYYSKALVMAQGSFPSRFKGFHVVNDISWLTGPAYRIFSPLLNKKTRSRVYFHGNDMQDLHKYICPTILPDIFGGTGELFDAQEISKAMMQLHDEVVKKSYYGFLEA